MNYKIYLKRYPFYIAVLFITNSIQSQISNVHSLNNDKIKFDFDMDSTRVRFKSLIDMKYLDGFKKIIYSDQSYSIIDFSNGYPDGKWILNDKKGKTERITDYKEGKKHGKEIYFYPSGTKKLVAIFFNGYQDGITEMYYPSGIKGGEFFSKEGKKHGVEIWTKESNGRQIYKAYYLNNKKVDSITFFSIYKKKN